jgi:aminopeptidase
MDDATLTRLADLYVQVGANVQPGQVVSLEADVGKESFSRAVAAAAYRAGAKFVDLQVFDPWVKRARIEHASEDTLDYVPPWYGERVLALGRDRCARIRLDGPVAPGLLDDLDQGRVGRDQLPRLKESMKVVGERTVNWTIGPAPVPAWAEQVFPELPPEEALDRLEREVVHVLRLDEDDPVQAWRNRQDELVAVAQRLSERRFRALRFRGEGTDLTVGLLPSSTWISARFETADGILHAPNLPSEEVFTSPDPEMTEGHVRSTRPLVLGGSIVEGLEVRFEGGVAVDISARRGAEALNALADKDPGGRRLGEVALVDGSGRIGPLGTVFYDTLLDENAASHVALGANYPFAIGSDEDRERGNVSEIHTDFMIGAPEMEVDGVGEEGDEVPVLRDGRWAI